MSQIDFQFNAKDQQWMAQAIELAKKGRYQTTPNPCVGCVLVKDGELVGQGWHCRAGLAHAEVEALNDAGDKAKGATAYVTLQPCNFVGKTGACAVALVEAGVSQVVYAMEDPNPSVMRDGDIFMEQNGVVVKHGLMREEAEALNPGFISRMQRKRPLVILKTGASLDGATAMASGESQWITGEASRADVQRLRAESCVIVTGINTVIDDDPAMSVRNEELLQIGVKQPAVVVLDSKLRMPLTSQLIDRSQHQEVDLYVAVAAETLIKCNSTSADHALGERYRSLMEKGVKIFSLPVATDSFTGLDLSQLLVWANQQEFNSLLIEAGSRVATSALEQSIVDEWFLYLAPKLLGKDIRSLSDFRFTELAEAKQFTVNDVAKIGDDIRLQLQHS